jgi:hypothetical protein
MEEMISRRFVPVAVIAAVLVCLALMGVPWVSSAPVGNFSGRLVYAAGEGRLDLKGSFNLYGLGPAPADVKLEIFIEGQGHAMSVDREAGTFSGGVPVHGAEPSEVRALLSVDGRVVADTLIALPPHQPARVHIIRFTSSSLS